MSIDNEVEVILARLNIPELTRIASSLRGGGEKSCRFQPGFLRGDGFITVGCAHYHGWIVFDDGVKWIVRIPQLTALLDTPLDLVNYFIESEYATLKFIEQRLPGVPAPRAHGFGLFSDTANLVGVGYILEDHMPGQPFCDDLATEAQKSHVYDQYADMLIDISRVPRRQACSLLPSNGKEEGDNDGDTKEAPIASNRFIWLGKHGPFASPLEYFTSIADIHLDLIADGQLYPEYPKEAYLFYRLLRDKAAPVLAGATTTSAATSTTTTTTTTDEPSVNMFFLKHVDDIGDHFLVDDDYNITGVIDWKYARFAPASEAFGPSLLTADLDKLHTSATGPSADDIYVAESLRRKGREDLACFAAGSELARRFHYGLGTEIPRDQALRMIEAVLTLLDNELLWMERVEDWMEREWVCCSYMSRDALRHDKVEALMKELERESAGE